MALDRLQALQHVLSNMRDLVKDGRVDSARRINEQALTILLDATFAQDRAQLSKMREQFAAVRSELRGERTPDEASAFDAILDANLVFATLASRRRPDGVKIALDGEASNARSAVLAALRNHKSMTTGDLAKAAKVRPETMSRTLTALKAEGLISSRRTGRSIHSRLTARGRAEAGENRTKSPSVHNSLLLSGRLRHFDHNLLFDLPDFQSSGLPVAIEEEMQQFVSAIAEMEDVLDPQSSNPAAPRNLALIDELEDQPARLYA